MSTAHTPGPWHIGMRPGPIVYGPKGEQVADLRGDLLPKDESAANLRLIAAAPDLLAALRAVDMECREIGSGDVSIPSYIMDLIMQVMAKAEGRS